MSLLGIVCASVGFLYALVVVCVYIFEGNPVKGWAPIIVIMLTVGGFQMIMLGMIGEYVWRTLEQARGREHYIINKMLTKRECVHEQ